MRKRNRWEDAVGRAGWRPAGLLLAALLPVSASAETGVPAEAGAGLPTPLTLEQALTLAGEAHPDLELAHAGIDAARAELLQAGARGGLRSYLELTPQWVDPSAEPGDEIRDDSRARLVFSKQLFDFGRTRALESSALARIAGREVAYLDARQRHRLEVMARFFDVLLADLRYAVDNEAMAHAYVNFDRMRHRRAVGQISDVDLLEHESRYQDTLIVRTESQKRQSRTRLQLAFALNRPDELPAELERPALSAAGREVPEYKAMLQEVGKSNPALQALRREVEAAQATLDAEYARRRPAINAEVEAARYRREIGAREDLRATLNLRIPLYQGGEDTAAIAAARARLREQQARLAKAEHDLRQTALDLVQELETLKVRRQAAKVRSDYRDLYLDRSRALYELEVKTDLGDAMTRQTEAQYLSAQAEFQFALVWARIDALGGRLFAPAKEKTQ